MMTQPESYRTISSGDILVRMSTPLPGALRLEADPTGSGWVPIAGDLDRRQLETQLSADGWTFFYMANVVTTTAFGFGRPGMIHSAMKRLMAIVTLRKCNCLEIDHVATNSFLGLPYVSISAHARHIQKGLRFVGQ